ncbi:ribosome silencing factor [Phreatobacter sp. AB_2022a]|uniref:ribosome silencing factor n=1 Tax=Phreatobacter sp. AB_2022a TaxID=3003134 RepID=UPI003FA6C616
MGRPICKGGPAADFGQSGALTLSSCHIFAYYEVCAPSWREAERIGPLSTTHLPGPAKTAPLTGTPAASPAAAEVLKIVLDTLEDNKAEEIQTIDLKGKTTIADAMVVSSGRSHRHVGAIADYLVQALKDAGVGQIRVEGVPACDWVLVDAGDVIVHIFRPEVRAFYNLEKMWSAARPPDRLAG